MKKAAGIASDGSARFLPPALNWSPSKRAAAPGAAAIGRVGLLDGGGRIGGISRGFAGTGVDGFPAGGGCLSWDGACDAPFSVPFGGGDSLRGGATTPGVADSPPPWASGRGILSRTGRDVSGSPGPALSFGPCWTGVKPIAPLPPRVAMQPSCQDSQNRGMKTGTWIEFGKPVIATGRASGDHVGHRRKRGALIQPATGQRDKHYKRMGDHETGSDPRSSNCHAISPSMLAILVLESSVRVSTTL